MKISTNSWHYKLVDKFYIEASPSLCKYFWQATWVTLFLFVITPVFVIGFTVMATTMFPWVLGDMLFKVIDHHTEGTKIVDYLWRLGTGYLIILLFVALVFAQHYYRLVIKPKRKGQDKEPNLFTSYVKAKKDKICPIIDFVDDEDSDEPETT